MLVYSNIDEADETQKTISGLQKTCSLKASETTCEVRQVDTTKQTQESGNAFAAHERKNSYSFQPPASPISANVKMNESVCETDKENQGHDIDEQVFRT